jgi:nicotinate phosphoribosyltransferase
MINKYHVSILDSDLYKFNMQQAICMLYPRVKARYTFKNRDNRELPEGFAKNLRKIINDFRGIVLTKDEYDFLQEKCYYLNPVYLDFLRGYRYEPNEVTIIQTGPVLDLQIEGLWAKTVLWEVPLMSTISELFFEMTGQAGKPRDERHLINRDKAIKLAANDIFYSEFGTRRRFSYENQDQVVEDLEKFGEGHMLGTSNPHLAMKYDLTPMGTVAHEWYQAHAAMFGYQMANEMANEAWVKVYQGDMGTALPDTFTTNVFLRTFNTKFAKLFDGLRQDSGNPFSFIDKAVNHYKNCRINPMYKYAMFSDNLKAIDQIRKIH